MAGTARTIALGGAITVGNLTSSVTNGFIIDTNANKLTLNTGITNANTLTIQGLGGIALGGNNTWNNAGTLNVYAPISGAYDLTKTGAGALNLYGVSSFTGNFIIGQGAAAVYSGLANSGVSSAIGAGSAIVFGTGQTSTTTTALTYAGGIGAGASSAPTTVNRTIILNMGNSSSTASIFSQGPGALIFTGPLVNNDTVSNATLNLSGTNTGANEIKSDINLGSLLLVKQSTGNWTLSGNLTGTGANSGPQVQGGNLILNNNNNSFNGSIAVYSGGVLSFTSIAQSGTNSALGNSSAVFTMGTNGGGGTLNYIGSSGNSTSRQIKIGNVANATSSATATILNNGANGGTGLVFTNAAFNQVGGTASNGNRSLTLGGANTDANAIQGVIADNNAGNATIALIKSGVGTWTISGNNTFTGGMTVNGGTLNVGNGTTGYVANNALTFGGTGKINFNEAAGRAQAMGVLTVSAGDVTVQSTYGTGSGNSTLTFSNVTARAAGTGINFATSGGTNGTTNNIVLTQYNGSAPTTGALISTGVFFGGNNYAAYDTGGFLRGLTTGDTNYVGGVSGANAIVDGATTNVALTGAVTAQGNASVNTLNMGANNVTLANGATLGTNGILASGGTNIVLDKTTASTLQATAAGGELVIRVDGSTDVLTINPVIQNNTSASSLTKVGAGTLSLNGTNTFTGNMTIASGTLQIGGAGSITQGATQNIVNNGTLLFSSSANQTWGGPISGTGGLTKDTSSTSVLTLNYGINTFTGDVNVNAGTIYVTGYNAAAGALGSQTVNRNVNVGSGATLQFGASDTFGGVATNPSIVLNVNGGTVNFASLSTQVLTVGNVNLNGGTMNAGTGNSVGEGFLFNAPTVNGTVMGGSLVTVGGTSASTMTGVGTANSNFKLGTSVTFNVADATSSSAPDLIVSAPINGSGSLIKTGVGTMALTAANTFTGNTTITAGVLQLGNRLALQNSILDTSNSITGTATDGLQTTLTGNLGLGGLSGNKALSSVFTTASGGYNGVTNLILTPSTLATYNTYIGGIADGAPGMTLTKNGTGAQVLYGTNTYTGATQVNAGDLVFGNTAAKAAGTVTAGNNATIGLVVGPAASGYYTTANVDSLFANNLAGFTLSNATLSGVGIDTSVGDLTYATNQTGGRGLVKTGANTLTLTGNSNFGGSFDSSGNVVTNGLTIQNGNVVLGGNLTNTAIIMAAAGQGTFTQNVGSVISGSSSLGARAGSTGTTTLNGANTYTGQTLWSASTLMLGNEKALGNTSLLTFYGGYLDVSRNLVLANNIAQSWSWGWTFTGSGGSLDMGTGNVTLSAGLTNSVTVTANTLVVGGVVSGTSGNQLGKAGAGTMILTGANTYAGNTTVSAGKLIARSASALGTGSTANVAVSANATLSYVASTDTQLAIGGNLTITGGATTNIGTSIGGSATSAEINVAGNATITNAAQKINIYGVNGVSHNAGLTTLIHSTTGGSLNPATAPTLGTVYNNTDFTVGAFTVTATDLQVTTAAATPITTAFWTGGLTNATNVWAASNGSTASNWLTALGGGATAVVPGSTADVTIGATTITTAPTATVLGADMSIKSLTFADTTNVFGLNYDGYKLTVGAGGITWNTGVKSGIIAAPIVLGANQTWTNNSANATTFTGVVSGANNLTIAGTGFVVLSGPNTYNGTTTINSGASLQLGSGGTGGSLSTASAITDNGTLVFRRSDTITQGTDFASNISGTGGVLNQQNMTGTTVLSGANSFTGQTNISGGTMSIDSLADYGSNSALGKGTAGTAIQMGQSAISATLNFTGSGSTSNRTFQLGNGAGDSSATINNNGSGALVFTASGFNITTANTGNRTLVLGGSNTGANEIQGVIVDNSANQTVSLTKADAGTWKLSGANTYTGATTVNAGTLQIGGAGQLGAGNYAAAITNSGTFQYSSSANQTLGGIISGTGALVKDTSSSSVLTLNGNNTYTGATTISTGTLALGSSGSISSTSGVAVASGATFDVSATGGYTLGGSSVQTLSGYGTVNGPITIGATGTVHPSAGAIGTMTFTSGLTATSGATFSFNINSTAISSDLLAITGTTNLGGASLVLNDIGANPSFTGSMTLLTSTSLTGQFLNQTEGSTITVGSNTYVISYLSNMVTLSISAVPEPSTTAALVGAMILGLAIYRRRRS